MSESVKKKILEIRENLLELEELSVDASLTGTSVTIERAKDELKASIDLDLTFADGIGTMMSLYKKALITKEVLIEQAEKSAYWYKQAAEDTLKVVNWYIEKGEDIKEYKIEEDSGN